MLFRLVAYQRHVPFIIHNTHPLPYQSEYLDELLDDERERCTEGDRARCGVEGEQAPCAQCTDGE